MLVDIYIEDQTELFEWFLIKNYTHDEECALDLIGQNGLRITRSEFKIKCINTIETMYNSYNRNYIII